MTGISITWNAYDDSSAYCKSTYLELKSNKTCLALNKHLPSSTITNIDRIFVFISSVRWRQQWMRFVIFLASKITQIRLKTRELRQLVDLFVSRTFWDFPWNLKTFYFFPFSSRIPCKNYKLLKHCELETKTKSSEFLNWILLFSFRCLSSFFFIFVHWRNKHFIFLNEFPEETKYIIKRVKETFKRV